MENNEKRAAATAATPAELVDRARSLYLGHRYGEALAVADRLLSFAARGYSVRALCLAEIGKPEEGLRAAEAGVACDPGDAVVLTTRAFCRHRLGDNVGADDDYRRAFVLDPGNYKIPYNYACYWAERNDVARCRAYLEKAVEIMPPGVRLTMLEDPDLARFQGEEWFRELALRARARVKNVRNGTG